MAREAGAMILADDTFSTIVSAVREGRILFGNLRKGVRYYLSCKVALVLITLLPVLLGAPVPFTPLQIILMELFMDLGAAAAFALEKGERDAMRRPPRDPKARFMDGEMVTGILGSAAGLWAAVSVSFLVLLFSGLGIDVARTAAFCTWLLGHALLAFAQRSGKEPLIRFGLLGNRFMLAWAGAAALFVAASVLLPGLRNVLQTIPLTAREWLLVAGAAAAGTLWREIPRLRKPMPPGDAEAGTVAKQ
jgi:Ca2+-transporting ATPase